MKGKGPKGKHPYDTDRPESVAVRRALEKQDLEALKLALTPRQRAFAYEYVVDFNATAAALRAGYAKSYADRQGYLLVKHKGVAFLIDHLIHSTAAKVVQLDKDYVVQGILAIANKDGARDGDKLRAFELLARHLGMLTDKQEIKASVDIAEKQAVEEEAQNFTHLLKGLKERAKQENQKKDISLL